jgi:hypothetical protein
MVALWSTDARDDAPSAMSFDALRELRCARGASAEEPRTLRARDLYDPVLLESDDALHLVACAQGPMEADGPALEYVWSARLDLDRAGGAEQALWERGVDGRFLAEGVDPRAARVGDETIVALRVPANVQERKGEAPLHFYRSTDLATWTLDEALSGGLLVRGDYAFASAGGALWVATTVGEDGSAAAARRFDPSSGSWNREAELHLEPTRPELPRGRCWLVPRPAGSGLELLHLAPSGRVDRLAL